MVDRAALRAADPPGVRRCPFRHQGHMQRCSEAAATDRLAPTRNATRPAARQRQLPDARIRGGEVSFLNLPSHHSITLSARARRVGEISRPSVFAILRLMISLNLVGCWAGKSAGLVPLRILSTKPAARP